MKLIINKEIVYNNKHHQIDFDILERYSNHFYENRMKYKNLDEITFSKVDFNVSDESFHNFISFCQMRFDPNNINNSNIFDLYFLSIKFGVQELRHISEDYIAKNYKNLIFQSISFKIDIIEMGEEMAHDKNLFNLQKEEEIIASHFFEYINDERLLHLPVKYLYNIINNDMLSFNNLDQMKQNQFIDFLFQCLDYHKKDASVLFLKLDIENQRIELISRLKKDYSDKFDFSYLNQEFLMKTISDMLSEMNLLKIEYSNITQEHATQTKQDEQKYEKILKEQEEQIKNYEDKYQKLLQINKEQIEQSEQKIQEITKATNDQLNDMKKYFEGIIGQQNKIIEDQKSVIQSIQNDLHILNNYDKLEVFKYQPGSEFEGIIKSLTTKTGGNIHNNGTIKITTNSQYANCVPQNMLDFDSGDIKNELIYHSDNIENTIVCFDFKNRFVRLSNYSIMSKSCYESCLRNWVIEASNDEKIWVTIDTKVDNNLLNGERNIHTFNIEQKNSDFYRFIRLRQTGKSWRENGTQFYISIYQIEFFGALRE